MIPYAKLAALVAAIGLGAAICYWTYASPTIARRDATIAQMKAADEKATADFQAAARKQEQEAQDARNKVESDYMAAQKQRDAIIARLSADGNGLRNTIATYAASHRCGLPEAPGAAPVPDAATATLGNFLQSADRLAEQCSASAEAIADQLRALQAFEASK